MGSAAGVAPEEGGWKGKTKQGFYVYFGVGEGAVKNVRLTFREVVCGKQSVHLPESRLAIDEAGHFAGALCRTGSNSKGPSSRRTGSAGRSSASKRPGCQAAPARLSASAHARADRAGSILPGSSN